MRVGVALAAYPEAHASILPAFERSVASPDWKERLHAARALTAMAPWAPQALPLLIRMLRDPGLGLCEAALEGVSSCQESLGDSADAAIAALESLVLRAEEVGSDWGDDLAVKARQILELLRGRSSSPGRE